MSQRTERIDELLRQEIGQALEREVADPAVGFVTVTEVETSPDLAHARVWVSVIGDERRRREALAALRRAMPYVRRGLGGKLRIRRIPELEVRLDDSAQRGTRVLHLIEEIEKGRLPVDDVAPPDESLPIPVPRIHHEGDAAEPELEIPPAEVVRRKPARRHETGGGRDPRGEHRGHGTGKRR